MERFYAWMGAQSNALCTCLLFPIGSITCANQLREAVYVTRVNQLFQFQIWLLVSSPTAEAEKVTRLLTNLSA